MAWGGLRAGQAGSGDDAVRLLDALDSDRVADILRELKGAPRQRILDLLPAQRADRIRGLLSWPQDSAAAHMVPEMLTVSPGVTVAEAIAMVRAEANALRTDARTGAYVFIVDDDPSFLQSAERAAAECGVHVVSLPNARAAIDRFFALGPVMSAEQAVRSDAETKRTARGARRRKRRTVDMAGL